MRYINRLFTYLLILFPWSFLRWKWVVSQVKVGYFLGVHCKSGLCPRWKWVISQVYIVKVGRFPGERVLASGLLSFFLCCKNVIVNVLYVCWMSAAECCRRMKDERLAMLNEANRLTDEIAALQTDIRSVVRALLTLLYTLITWLRVKQILIVNISSRHFY